MPIPNRPPPFLDSTTVVPDPGCQSREEVIKILLDNLIDTGRISDDYKVEEKIWSREDIASTSLGFGFALPHAQSEAVIYDSISLVKLVKPLYWQIDDDSPVRLVVLLTAKAGHHRQHLRWMAQLARKIMSPDFRDAVDIQSPAEIMQLLQSYLEAADEV